MNSRLWLSAFLLVMPLPALAFVHIHQLKPHLAVSPAQPLVTFFWNGAYPELKEKDKVFDGTLAEASDRDIMQALLDKAVRTWTDVPTSYLELEIVENAAATLDMDDESFSIVVEAQSSKVVAAAALPSFITQDPSPSDNERDSHLIHDCDITVSDSAVEAESLLHTLVHEMGHCLGLGHPHSTYNSIMSYATLDRTAKLSLDDEAGISFLYPEPDQSQAVHSLTCGGLGGSSQTPLLNGLLFLLPMVFGLCKALSPRNWEK